MMESRLKPLFRAHVAARRRQYSSLLRKYGYGHLILFSGDAESYYRDDIPVLYRAGSDFLCSFAGDYRSEGFIIFNADASEPIYTRLINESVWDEPPPLLNSLVTDNFVVEEFRTKLSLANYLERFADDSTYLGPDSNLFHHYGINIHRDSYLRAEVDYSRPFKTLYEQECILRANAIAAKGHRAARSAFLSGRSEADIHFEYLRGAGLSEQQLPYPAICAKNDNSSTLHYGGKSFSNSSSNSMLIDSGAQYIGYAADITRTYASQRGMFAELVSRLDLVQQQLISGIHPDLSFVELDQQAHLLISNLLVESGVVRISAEDTFTAGVSSAFFPHGLGHYIGVQVHDLGGRMITPGQEQAPPDYSPYLRITRQLQDDQVFTIEPGIYFNPLLLQKLRTGPHSKFVNWSLVDDFVPFGGIRVEDTVLLSNGRAVNLTRKFLPT